MLRTKERFIKHKYLLYSVTLIIVILLKLGFNADSIVDFFYKLLHTFLNTKVMGFGIFIVSILSMWVLYPFAPKHEDFTNDKEREDYFHFGNWDLWLFIILVVATTIVFLGVYTIQ